MKKSIYKYKGFEIKRVSKTELQIFDKDGYPFIRNWEYHSIKQCKANINFILEEDRIRKEIEQSLFKQGDTVYTVDPITKSIFKVKVIAQILKPELSYFLSDILPAVDAYCVFKTWGAACRYAHLLKNIPTWHNSIKRVLYWLANTTDIDLSKVTYRFTSTTCYITATAFDKKIKIVCDIFCDSDNYTVFITDGKGQLDTLMCRTFTVIKRPFSLYNKLKKNRKSSIEK
jgi:hypothetical protein